DRIYGRLTHAHGVEAGAAIDRPVAARQERHLGAGTALGADGRVHLAARAAAVLVRGSAIARVAARRPAGRAAARLVHQAFEREELLLTGREDEVRAAFAATQHFVCEHPSDSPPSLTKLAWPVIRGLSQTSHSVTGGAELETVPKPAWPEPLPAQTLSQGNNLDKGCYRRISAVPSGFRAGTPARRGYCGGVGPTLSATTSARPSSSPGIRTATSRAP